MKGKLLLSIVMLSNIFLFAFNAKADKQSLNDVIDQAYLFYKQGKYEKATEFAEKAFEINREDLISIANLAAIYIKQGDNEKAKPLIEKLQLIKNESCKKLAETEDRYREDKVHFLDLMADEISCSMLQMLEKNAREGKMVHSHWHASYEPYYEPSPLQKEIRELELKERKLTHPKVKEQFK